MSATMLDSDIPDLPGEHYHQILVALHESLRPRTYLEIGVFHGSTLQFAKGRTIAVDPKFQIQDPSIFQRCLNREQAYFFQLPSDEFFENAAARSVLRDGVDFAFLDGMHQCEFLLRDFANTEKYCRATSVIALHDCLPVDVSMTGRDGPLGPPSRPNRRGWWTGDVWRTALILKRRRPDLEIKALNARETGLIVITNLNSTDNTILGNLDACYEEMKSWDISKIGLRNYYEEMKVEHCSVDSIRAWAGSLAPAGH